MLTLRGRAASKTVQPSCLPDIPQTCSRKPMAAKRLNLVLVMAALLASQAPVCAYTVQYRDSSGVLARRWLAKPIIVAFSSSLWAPPPNIKAGSDVIGAARRALQHWSAVADIQFLETTSSVQTVSPQNAGDRINLITVAADNVGVFGDSGNPGRTRVFFDGGGAINEADIALNPGVEFSSDGSAGTYDLESTLTHEVGHLLGLEHSAILGATMQPRQAMNGVYNLPAFTQRTLAEDDIAGARSLYGSRSGTGSVAGRLIARSFAGQSRPIFGGHVFLEDAATGRVVAGSVTLPSGDYRIDGIEPGSYRVIGQTIDGPVTADEIANGNGGYASLFETTPPFETKIATRASSQFFSVNADSTTAAGFFVSSNPAPAVKPRLIGMNGDLSTVGLPLTRGKTVRIYIAGEGLDKIPAAGVATSSPFIAVNSESVAEEDVGAPYPALSFEITVARDTPPGDYSLVMQAADGELVYLVGVLIIEP